MGLLLNEVSLQVLKTAVNLCLVEASEILNLHWIVCLLILDFLSLHLHTTCTAWHIKVQVSPSKSSESATSPCQCLSSHCSTHVYHWVKALMYINTQKTIVSDFNTHSCLIPTLPAYLEWEVISAPLCCSSHLTNRAVIVLKGLFNTVTFLERMSVELNWREGKCLPFLHLVATCFSMFAFLIVMKWNENSNSESNLCCVQGSSAVSSHAACLIGAFGPSFTLQLV